MEEQTSVKILIEIHFILTDQVVWRNDYMKAVTEEET